MDVKEAFKLCQRCGATLDDKDGYKLCAKCGLHVYNNPKPCVSVALINESNEVLLVKRAIEPSKGLWDFPGGFVELNETLEKNAERELKEELGIDIDPSGLRYICSGTIKYLFDGIDYPLVIVLFVARMPAGAKPIAADDVSEYRFFSFKDLPTDKYSDPAMKSDLEKVAKYLKKNKL